MKNFAEYIQSNPVKHSCELKHFTLHFQKQQSNASMIGVYKFDKGIPFDAWLNISQKVFRLLVEQPDLISIIKIEPFLEIGTDYFTQKFYSADGSYTIGHYREFLDYGDNQPTESFFHQFAELQLRVGNLLERLKFHKDLSNHVLASVIHATFFKRDSNLVWMDEDGWRICYPIISVEDIVEWSKYVDK